MARKLVKGLHNFCFLKKADKNQLFYATLHGHELQGHQYGLWRTDVPGATATWLNPEQPQEGSKSPQGELWPQEQPD